MKRSELPSVRKIINLEKIVVGEILNVMIHPYGNFLRIASVHVGNKFPFQIIFGGSQSEKIGMKVAVALPGTLTHGGKLRKRKFRGLHSEAMICSMLELGICKEGPDEIMSLPVDLLPGTPLKEVLPRIYRQSLSYSLRI